VIVCFGKKPFDGGSLFGLEKKKTNNKFKNVDNCNYNFTFEDSSIAQKFLLKDVE